MSEGRRSEAAEFNLTQPESSVAETQVPSSVHKHVATVTESRWRDVNENSFPQLQWKSSIWSSSLGYRSLMKFLALVSAHIFLLWSAECTFHVC